MKYTLEELKEMLERLEDISSPDREGQKLLNDLKVKIQSKINKMEV